MEGIWQVLSSGNSFLDQQQQQQQQLLLETVQDLPALPVMVAGGGVAALLVLFPSLLPAPARLVDDQTLSDIVRGTFLENKELKCAYKASRDGWSALDFHQAVDNRGCGVVVAKTAAGIGGAVFGGFNPAGWRSTDDYYTSSTAFLWAKSSFGGGSQVSKFPILPGGNAAIFDYATSGPNFGAGDLQIGPPRGAIMGGFAGPDAEDLSSSAGNLRTCRASPGMTYGGTAMATNKWPVRGTVRLVEVEVYCQPKF
jgi:TLD